jgi:hypothetical protein
MRLNISHGFLITIGMLLLGLSGPGCFPLGGQENEIDWDDWSAEVKQDLRVTAPVACTNHSLYRSGNADLPYRIQQQRWMVRNRNDCPRFHEYIKGSDLGVSVHFEGARDDLIYFGDTNLVDGPTYKRGPEFYLRDTCAYKGKPRCDDAYGVIRDNNPVDGVNVEIQTTEWAHLNPEDKIKAWDQGYGSIRLLGLNAYDRAGGLKSFQDGSDLFGDYNTPTGAMPITGYTVGGTGEVVFEQGRRNGDYDPAELDEAPGVLMVFATASNEFNKKQSWLGCSADGVNFGSCATPRESEITPLSNDKFIQVAPVPFSRDDVAAACEADPESIFCDLDGVLDDLRPAYGQGALLFGNGKTYRCSPVYLAYYVMATGETWFYGDSAGPAWSRSEGAATAIIQPGIPGYTPRDTEICIDFNSDQAAEARDYLFGELSVMRVDNHFVMLSGHIRLTTPRSGFLRIMYRTAELGRPEIWAEPLATGGVGYGPYILDRYTEIVGTGAGQRLSLYHVVSTWNPSFDPGEPYAVMTRPLNLLDTGQPPPWPPE